MWRYLIRRAISGVAALFVLITVLYFVVEAFIPGDFFTPSTLVLGPDAVAELREEYGLDDPLVVQYFRFVGKVFTGQFDLQVFRSTSNVYEALPPTLLVFTVGLWFAYVFGSWLGRRTAWKGGVVSDSLTVVGIGSYTLFPPFLAFLIVHFFGSQFGRWREAALGVPPIDIWLASPLSPTAVMWRMVATLVLGAVVMTPIVTWFARRRKRGPSGLLLGVGAIVLAAISWALMDIGEESVEIFFRAIFPLLAFTILAFGEFMFITQTAVAAVVHDDYIGTARAKGLPTVMIRDRHAGRVALLVVVTRLAVSLPFLLTGLVIVERAVGWPGLGNFLFDAIEAQDMPSVMGSLMLIGVIIIFIRLTLDIMTVALDPRIRVSAGNP